GPIPDVVGLLNDFKPDDMRLTLAARVTGDVKTAFPDGPPKPAAKKDEKPADKTADKAAEKKPDAADDAKAAAKAAQLLKSKQPINVVVVADTDMLDDRLWVQRSDFFGQHVAMPTANNGDFVANAVES